MNHEPFQELAAAFALGALEGEERSRFEAHLRAGCQECEAALTAYGESLATLAAELPPVAPPPRIKAALMARVEAAARLAGSPTPTRPGWSLWRRALAGALATAAVAVVYLGWRVNVLDRELARRADELAAIRTQVAEQREILQILRSPEAQLVALGGQRPSPTASGRMWWQRGVGGFFVASGLPVTPPGKTYQLWAIAEGKPVSAGVFEVDPNGNGTLRVKPLPEAARVEAFAVTLEPADGLPQPSGEMYLAGKTL